MKGAKVRAYHCTAFGGALAYEPKKGQIRAIKKGRISAPFSVRVGLSELHYQTVGVDFLDILHFNGADYDWLVSALIGRGA
jgi:hypothetical protein